MGNLNVKRLVLGPVRTNCYIVYNDSTREGIVFDPASTSDKIKEFLEEENIKLKGIFLTHGHFDHIGGARMYQKMYDVQIYCHEDEADVVNDLDINLSSAFGEAAYAEADVLLRDGQKLSICDFDIEVIHTPGHTKGSCCYLIKCGEDKILISGDTLFAGSHGRVDFPTGSMSQIVNSITKKLLCLEDDLLVLPGHEFETTIADEKPLWRMA